MTERNRRKRFSRRHAIAGTTAALAIPLILAPQRPALGQFRSRLDSQRFYFDGQPNRTEAQAILKAILRERQPIPGRVVLEVPDIAENGAAVPIRIAVNCAMTWDDYPKVVHLLAMENPFTEVGKYWFTPDSGNAEVTLRCRLRASGIVVAIAEMIDGTVGLAQSDVSVTLGSCS